MERWSAAHRAFAVETFFKNGDSAIRTQRIFRQHFNIGRHGHVPDRHTINNWVRKFRTTASTEDKKHGGKPKTVRTPENIERVRIDFQRSPKRSAHRHAQTLGISRTSLRRILHKDLNFHPYKLQIVQELSDRDHASRRTFCEQFIELTREQPDLIRRVIMSDEAHFQLCGSVNKQNMRYWSDVNPLELHQKPLHSQKVTVWCGFSAFGIIGPYFFEDQNGNTVTVTSDRYVAMLNEFVFPQLQNLNIDLASVYFQHDGATAHTARHSMATLRTVFEGRLISRFGDIPWPPRSPDLTACDFFLWGYLKHKVFATRPDNLDTLKQRIRNEIRAIPDAMRMRVMENVVSRLHECIEREGGI